MTFLGATNYNDNCTIYFFNCNSDFATAEIVINYTLKYALQAHTYTHTHTHTHSRTQARRAVFYPENWTYYS